MRISTAVLAKCKCFNVHFQNMYYGNMAVIIINNNVIICILTKIDLGEGEKLTTVHIYILHNPFSYPELQNPLWKKLELTSCTLM